jgi:two-component system NarL family response regulator
MSTRVLLVDDHVLFREALRALLENRPDMEVVGEASDGGQVEELVERLSPDIVLIDVNLPTVNGVEATRRLLAKHPRLKIIAVSAFVYKRFVLDMLDAGALGYVSKSDAGEDLIRAILDVAQGKRFLCQEAATMLIDATRRGRRPAAERGSDSRLGRREKEVLTLLAEGMSTPQIAAKLHIAASTVNVHRRNIMRKVGLHTVAELTKYAIREGLITA